MGGRCWSTTKGRHLPPYLQPPGLGLGWGSQGKLVDKVRFKVRSKWLLHLGSSPRMLTLFMLYSQGLE